jgi:hypothetical protein
MEPKPQKSYAREYLRPGARYRVLKTGRVFEFVADTGDKCPIRWEDESTKTRMVSWHVLQYELNHGLIEETFD